MSSTIPEINDIVAKVENLVGNARLLKLLVEDNRNVVEHKYIIRLSKWFHFFNENYKSNYFIYSNTVYALFDTCNQNELFKNQTEHEFEQSLHFYERIIHHTSLKKPINFVIAKHLLGLSLIYGKYGSMQINSFKNALKCIEDYITEDTLHHFFVNLFIRGKYPKIFPKNVTNFNSQDLELLMNRIKANNCINGVAKTYDLKTQALAIRYFIEQMDIEMIDAFLSEDCTYQDMEKHLFISKLAHVFYDFENGGDTQLLSFEGICNYCNKGKLGYTFVGNTSQNHISIIFETVNGYISDLYDCSSFKANIGNLELNQRLSIDFDVMDF